MISIYKVKNPYSYVKGIVKEIQYLKPKKIYARKLIINYLIL